MRLIASTLLAGALAIGSVAPAFADPPSWSNSRHNDRDRDRDWNDRDYRDGYRDSRRDDDRYDRRDDRRDDWNGRGWWDVRDNHHDWRRGDRFDRRVHTRYVVVNDYRDYRDYRGYRLQPPGRGQYYARNNDTGEILLIAAATGLVLWVLTN